MTLSTPEQRLRHFITERFGGNRSAFARAAGLKSNMVGSYCADRGAGSDHKDPTAPVLDAMARAGLSIVWYRFGLGAMDFRPDAESDSPHNRRSQLLQEAQEGIDRLQEVVEALVSLG